MANKRDQGHVWAQVGTGKGGWKKIKGTWVEVSGSVPKHAENWACCNCDEGGANYQGIYGFYKHCPNCKVEKRLCQSMSMATRKKRFEEGTLIPRGDRKAKDKDDKGKTQGGKQTTKMAGSALAGQWLNGPPPSLEEENRLLKIQVQNLTVEARKKNSGETEGLIDLTKVATDSTGESAPETTGQKSPESILQEIQKKLKSKKMAGQIARTKRRLPGSIRSDEQKHQGTGRPTDPSTTAEG